MRGLVMDFPNDTKARTIDDEYHVRPGLPRRTGARVQAHAAAKSICRRVRDWYDFQTGKRHAGGTTIDADAPLNRVPLFVRAGAIVPVGPAIQYTGQKPDAPITVYVYPGRDGSFSLYEDEGTNYGYEKGASSRIPLTYDDATHTLHLGERRGSFPGMVEKRRFRIRLLTENARPGTEFEARADREVDYTGQAVTIQL